MDLIKVSFGHSKAFERNAEAIMRIRASDKASGDPAGGAWGETAQPIRNMVKDMSIVSQVRPPHKSGRDVPVSVCSVRACASDTNLSVRQAGCV